MSYTAVGSFTGAGNTGALASFSLTTGGIGDFVLCEVISFSTGRVATSLSSSNATWAALGTPFTATQAATTKCQVFLGTVTSASTQTVTITWGAGATGAFEGVAFQEYSSTTGIPVLDRQGGLDSLGTANWVSLTPAAAGELYFGYAANGGVASSGSTTGYIYNQAIDANGNGGAYNLNCGASATFPVWGDTTEEAGLMVLVMPPPAGGGAGAAAPGRTWLRQFHHRQFLPPSPAAVVVTTPAPLYPLHGPVCARAAPGRGGTVTRRAGVLGVTGPPVRPLSGPVRGQPAVPLLTGRRAARAGTYTSVAPQSGPPVYPLHGPVQARALPARGGRTASRTGIYGGTGSQVYPLRRPVQAQQPPGRTLGRCAGRAGTFTSVVPQSGPPVYPLHGPVRTRPAPPPRGRCTGRAGTYGGTGPPAPVLHKPVAPFRPGPYRSGRCTGRAGTYGGVGSRVTPLQRPARARIPQAPRGGRTAGNPGAPVFVPPFTIGTLTAADAAATLTALTAAGGTAAGTLTANDQRTGGPA